MLETVSNPLLATIACALTKEGVEVPSAGSELYVKRIELFTGLYDQHRNIKRTQSPPNEILLLLSSLRITLQGEMSSFNALSTFSGL